MTEIGVQFSITDAPWQVVTKTTTSRRRKSLITPTTPSNLFNHHQRSHQMQYSAVLPVISLTSLSDFKEKFIRMTANNKSTKQTTTATSSSPTTTEFRVKMPSLDMPQTKIRTAFPNRSVVSNMPKSSLSYPTIVTRPTTPFRSNVHNYHQQQQQQQQQESARFLYVVNTPAALRRAASARISNSNLNPLPLHQQPYLLTSPLWPRPHPQYGHFLAYLRRQSIARMRRKQRQEEEGNTDHIETTISFHPIKTPSQLFHSTSSTSLGILTPETLSIPTLSPTVIRKTRPLSAYRQVQRSPSILTTNYRLNLNRSPPLRQPPPSSPVLQTTTNKTSNDQLLLVSPPSILITPTNSVVDDTSVSPMKKAPYELQLSGDMLNYCYVSDSGVKYQGQLLSTTV